MRSKQSFSVVLTLVFLAAGGYPLFAGLQEGRGEDIHFRGPVFAISQDSLDHVVQLTIRVNQAQQNVVLNEWTDVIRGRGFRANRNDIRLGDFVEVSGFFTTTGRIVAKAIHIETQDAIELQGKVESASGNLLRISGIDFIIDPGTYIHASGDLSSFQFSEIAQGTEARVRASEDGGFWLAREIELGQRTVESEPIRFSGSVTEVSTQEIFVDVGIRPVISVWVARGPNTEVDGYLKTGVFVEVEGRFPPGKDFVLASRIAVDSNRNGNVFDDSSSDGTESTVELEGTVRQLQRAGDGSAKSFYLNQILIRLQAQTAVRFEQGNNVENRRLQDGQPVEIEGTRLQDQSVLADRIQIRMQDPQGGPGGDPGGPGSGGGSGGNGEGDHGGPGEPELEIVDVDGVITSVSRLPDDSVQAFELDGKTIRVIAATIIKGRESETLPSSVLGEGVRVKVTGTEQPDGSIVASRIEIVGS